MFSKQKIKKKMFRKINFYFLKAALRQIAVSSETLESSDLLIEADIQQLIKPKTNESFLQSSSNEESYV